jgi:hypothetical protein
VTTVILTGEHRKEEGLAGYTYQHIYPAAYHTL